MNSQKIITFTVAGVLGTNLFIGSLSEHPHIMHSVDRPVEQSYNMGYLPNMSGMNDTASVSGQLISNISSLSGE